MPFVGQGYEPVTAVSTKDSACISISIGDGINLIQAGTVGRSAQIPYSAKIIGWTITECSYIPINGSISIEINKCTELTYPSMTAISGTEPPKLVSQIINSDSILSTWNIYITEGDCLGFIVNTVTNCKKVTLNIKLEKV